jgi:hypothetical protein
MFDKHGTPQWDWKVQMIWSNNNGWRLIDKLSVLLIDLMLQWNENLPLEDTHTHIEHIRWSLWKKIDSGVRGMTAHGLMKITDMNDWERVHESIEICPFVWATDMLSCELWMDDDKCQLIPWNTVPLEKLTVDQVIQKHSLHTVEPKGSLPHSQKPDICLC